jgi:TPR repeat protein
MVRRVTLSTLFVSVLLVGVAEAQVIRNIELKKLTAADVSVLKASALRGEQRSMTIVGIALAEGRGVAVDVLGAVRWLEKAAKTDDVAQEYLGTMLRNGRGVPQNQARARALFAKAASQGNRRAQYDYASLCFNGEGGPQDVDTAAKYFEIAARQGDPEAQHMIGRMYQYGRGVVQDFEQATRWYEAAAKQNHVPSIFALGISYVEGDMGVRDGERARKYLERAASMGSWVAAVKIANMYHTGDEAPRNDAEAYKWFSIARELSGVDTSPSTASLESQLKPLELASAQEEITQWKAMRNKQ